MLNDMRKTPCTSRTSRPSEPGPNMLYRRAAKAFFALFLTSIMACQGPTLVTPIDGLSSDMDQEGSFRLDQNRVVSLLGNAPGNLPGEATRFKNERALSTTFGYTSGPSYVDVLTVELEEGADPEEVVINVRNKIIAAQRAATKLVSTKLRVASLRSALDEAEDDAARTQAGLALESAEIDLKQQLEATYAAADEASKAVDQKGVIVFRWSTESHTSNRLSALFNLSSNSESQTEGYTIAAGWRENTLVVGNDIHGLELPLDEYWDWFVMKWGWFPWFGQFIEDKYARIVTRSVQTRAVAFLQNEVSQRDFKAQLKASVKELSSTAAALDAIDKIEVELAVQQAFNLTSEGVLAAPKRERIDSVVNMLKNGDLVDGHSDWLTLVLIDANYHDLLDLIKDQDSQ